jgi:hypothetical protein
MIGVTAGLILIGFGAVPGLFESFVNRVRNSINLFSSQFPVSSQLDVEVPQPVWLAGLGAVLIALTVAGFFTR